ncbi:MAG: hypothetical protein M3O31_02075 [Acidobacteriota bacterium]|nr:hypothetical protein [Acidobacteriota bacterium]
MVREAKTRSLIQTAQTNGFVSTPGGFRPRSQVHLVHPGESVIKRPGASFVMSLTTGSLDSSSENGIPPHDPADATGGWVTWGSWRNGTGTPISSFATTWSVPLAPANPASQLIYFFNGLQNMGGSEILQPVLQWGISGAGGGQFWSIASWHVDSQGHAYCTPSSPVNPGDILTGLMTMTGAFNNGTHNYRCEFTGVPGTALMALGTPELTDAEETLEAYGVTAQTEYPGGPSIAMSQIDLRVGGNPAPLAWAANTMQNPLYGETAVIVSNASPGGKVDLYY